MASAAVFLLSSFGTNDEPIRRLFISEESGSNLLEIRNGELWRLITPIFIHMDFMHIFFNMWWLRDLGSMIEGRQSTLQLLLLVLVIAVCSNLAQFYLAGPGFGGMSGVVYGLFGYICIRGKFDPGSGLLLHPTNVTLMIIWFFLCLIHVIPHVANGAHGAGLVVGMAWGYLSSLRYH
jgi:GlpG protein